MKTITFEPATACIMLNNEDQTNYIDYIFINKYKLDYNLFEVGEIMNEISNLIERNKVKNVSVVPMLKNHLKYMINEYRELGHFTNSSVAMLSDISIFTHDEITNEIIKFLNMYTSISNHAGMPVLKTILNELEIA